MVYAARARQLAVALGVLVALASRAATQQPSPRPEIAPPPAIVVGKVVGVDKKPLEQAEVILSETERTFTDRKGRFEFDPVLPGTHDVMVRKIGFVPVRFRVTVTAGDVWDGTLTLDRTALKLPGVVVLDSSKALKNVRPRWIDGFVERRRMGMGSFLDRVDIENAQAVNTAKLIARTPGITARQGFSFDELSVNRCDNGFGTNSKGVVYVDGFRTEESTSGRFATLMDYPPERLWAIEVYKGRGTIPTVYDEPQACLVILLWTNRR